MFANNAERLEYCKPPEPEQPKLLTRMVPMEDNSSPDFPEGLWFWTNDTTEWLDWNWQHSSGGWMYGLKTALDMHRL